MEKQAHRDRRDWVQETVIARAKALGLSAYAIAKAAGGAVSEDHVAHYLSRRASMGSHKLQHVLRALGLALVLAPAAGTARKAAKPQTQIDTKDQIPDSARRIP